MTAQERAKLAYEDRKAGMSYAEIAEKYGISVSTVKSMPARYWSQFDQKSSNKKVATKGKEKLQPNKGKLQPNKASPPKRGAPIGNKNAVGNSGGAPPGNQNAVTHGFFKKIFPQDEDTLDILDSIMEKEPEDIIWENIIIQYTAIARSQKIMFVKDQEDVTKVLKRVKKGKQGKEIEFEIQLPWDKQASYLQAQSRAMQTLSSLIRQFCDVADTTDERRLKIETMQLDIDKRKKELDFGKGSEVADDWVSDKKAAAEKYIEGLMLDE